MVVFKPGSLALEFVLLGVTEYLVLVVKMKLTYVIMPIHTSYFINFTKNITCVSLNSLSYKNSREELPLFSLK